MFLIRVCREAHRRRPAYYQPVATVPRNCPISHHYIHFPAASSRRSVIVYWLFGMRSAHFRGYKAQCVTPLIRCLLQPDAHEKCSGHRQAFQTSQKMTNSQDDHLRCSLSVIPEDSAEWLPDSPASPHSPKKLSIVTPGSVDPGSTRSTLKSSDRRKIDALQMKPRSTDERVSEYVGKTPCSCACALF